MKYYMGTKLVQAEPCPAWKDTDFNKKGDPGYKIVYTDSYTSWSPKDVFERAYLPLMKTDKPSISQDMVDDFIARTEVMTIGGKTTVVRAILKNGFELVEKSSCVSPENYDEKLGAEICMKKIKAKIWPLLGFLLQTAVYGVNSENGE